MLLPLVGTRPRAGGVVTEALVNQPADVGAGPVQPPAWVACPGCGWLLYGKRLDRSLRVCPECDHHLRVDAPTRIAQLADPGSFVAAVAAVAPERVSDPLRFTDLRPYTERLGEARAGSGSREAVLTGAARIGGHPVVLAVMDFGFLGGSLGVEAGRRITRAAEQSLQTGAPLVAVCASGGARMQEGALSLMQMARTSQVFGRLHEAGVLTVCVLTDPTYGGVSASFASLGSIVVAEQGAHIGFAGPRVVAQTIREDLPPGFQTAGFLSEHGLVDRVVSRDALRPLLVRLFGLHTPRTTMKDDAEPAPSPGAPELDAWQTVQAARDVGRPTTLDYLRDAFDDFLELHGDRLAADDPAMVGGLAAIGGRTVVVIGHQKGHTVEELVARNFGMPGPEGYRKAIRMLDYAERFGLPVVTLIDTPGAHPGLAAEEHGQSSAIAHTVLRIGRLRTPVVSVVIGEGGSGGALALCSADRLLMLERSYLSVISPEGCAAILWRSASHAPDAARALRLRHADLVGLGIADGMIPEPPGGAQTAPHEAARRLRAALITELDQLQSIPPDELRRARAARLDALDDVSRRPAPEGEPR